MVKGKNLNFKKEKRKTLYLETQKQIKNHTEIEKKLQNALQ